MEHMAVLLCLLGLMVEKLTTSAQASPGKKISHSSQKKRASIVTGRALLFLAA
jgi:hypothetical protein